MAPRDTVQTMAILSVGETALQMLLDASFERQWRELYETCAWATAFQSVDFIRIWYETYIGQFMPAIVSMEDAQGRLCGLLTVALNRTTAEVVYAGDRQSEYQVWLARPDSSDKFIREALAILRSTWPGKILMLRYIPPGTPLDWSSKMPRLRQTVRLLPAMRPLIGMSEGDVDRALNSKPRQRKLKALTHLGQVVFAKVERHEFAQVFEQAWPIYEFRQIAKYNCSRFLSDPALLPFYLAISRRSDLLHMTVLRVDAHIVAWLLGVRSIGYFHPLAFAHSPFHARQSPGTLHMLMVARMLMREENCVFDLTPGGDSYKEVIATSHERAHILYSYPGLGSFVVSRQMRERVARAMKGLLRLSMHKPATIMARATQRARSSTPGLTAGSSAETVKSGMPFREYRLEPGTFEQSYEPTVVVSRNRIADLLRYEPSDGTLQHFLTGAQAHIDHGADAYTCMRNGRLVACCWIVPGNRETPSRRFVTGVSAGTPLLIDFYSPASDPTRLLRAILIKWIANIELDGGEAPARLGIRFDNRPLNEMASQCGLRPLDDNAL